MLGVCYYPEHWPESMWANDAKEMKELGLKYVRIGEFAWSRLEAEDGVYTFDWLDRAIETLNNEGLQVILGTPTATPPKWLIDKFPSILPVDINTGVTRGFGSRRHYDFSSEDYLRESLRISELMAERYGDHKGVVGWQTDNELACHDTTHSGSENAKKAFQAWCKQRYGTVEKLNADWGNVFWSMEYQNFEAIELPILAVTETNPAHRLAYHRFSSDQVIHFHDEMIKVIRKHAVNQWVTHNFIPLVDTQTDDFALAKNLDFVSYDNYPLGRSDLFFADRPAEEFKPYMRTGHPDFSSYHFDQTRGISKGNFWIMEQQPGPVNWANHNPRPEDGMVRLWSWQAFAHGADCVCYFRWRQAPFAQEQMHAGVKRNDNSKAQAWYEIESVRDEVQKVPLPVGEKVETKVAILTHKQNQWVSEIERQGDSYKQDQVEFEYYTALRQLGLEVSFISPNCDFTPYQLIVAPTQPIVDQALIDKCKTASAHFVFGPRSGGKTNEFNLAPNLPPGLIQQLVPVKVLSTETTRPDCADQLSFAGNDFLSNRWSEELEVSDECEVNAFYQSGKPAAATKDRFTYVATLSCNEFLVSLFEQLANQMGLKTIKLAKDMRITKRGELNFVFNYSAQAQSFEAPAGSEFIVGSAKLAGHDVAIFKAK